MLAKALRIGLYGVSGVGKSYLLDRLNQYANAVLTLDGSVAIDQVCEGGLSTFKKLNAIEKYEVRCKSIAKLNQQFMADGRHMIVSGHYSFLTPTGYEVAWTEADASFYDLIFILQCSSELHFQRCNTDLSRNRNFSQMQLDEWREFEHNELQAICEASAIPFYSLSAELPQEQLLQQMVLLISDEVINTLANELTKKFDSVILCDCDGTLNTDDILDYSNDPALSLKKISDIFKDYNGYSPEAFFAVSQYIDSLEKNNIVENMLARASVLQPHQLIVDELELIRKTNNANGVKEALVLVSCGFPTAWDNPCLNSFIVLGGASFNRFGCILTNEHKTQLAKKLIKQGVFVVSFGNSSSDFGMLEKSSLAFFVYRGVIKTHYFEHLKRIKNIRMLCLEGS